MIEKLTLAALREMTEPEVRVLVAKIDGWWFDDDAEIWRKPDGTGARLIEDPPDCCHSFDAVFAAIRGWAGNDGRVAEIWYFLRNEIHKFSQFPYSSWLILLSTPRDFAHALILADTILAESDKAAVTP